MSKKVTTEDFIRRAKEVHGDKYDYSKVQYINAKSKVCIICPEHGEFWQEASTHLCGKGCVHCARQRNSSIRLRWTKEEIIKEAKKYKYQSDFKKGSYGAYGAAQKMGILVELHSLWETKARPRDFWNKSRCFEHSKECKTRTEFLKKYSAAYNKCRKNGWLDQMTWLLNQKDGKEHVDSVYVYIFEELKAAYIGRTLMSRQKKRDYEHRTGNDTLYRFSKQMCVDIPVMNILCDNLTVEQGCTKEAEYIEMYAKRGYFIINKAKAGVESSSCGALKYGKLTRRYCLEEAKKYRSRSEFQKGNPSAYLKSNLKGWSQDYTWFEELHKPQGYWDSYDNCYAEFLKYDSIDSFRKGSPFAYKSAVEHGFTRKWHTKRVAWNKVEWTPEMLSDVCSRYATRTELLQNNVSAYRYLSNHKLLDHYYPRKECHPSGYWNNLENVKRVAKNYATRWDFGKHEGSAYGAALRNGWLDVLFPSEVE